jgi:FkbH-like protein
MAENIRLVVWDLDGTFWAGTATEGGLRWRDDAAHAVRVLAARGIISAICSKNDAAMIDGILQAHGMADFFVFNSISWEPKGPRLAALIAAVRLRPETVLFIDDNPANLAEARFFVPGLQLARETIVPALLRDKRCQGKHDPQMSRLAQYRMLARRQADLTAQAVGGGGEDFLRQSGIVVSIEHDVGLHPDRAIELINRTNQLNFTKNRLPEEREAARAALRDLLSGHRIQAGLLRVRDNYGDHGYCGLYVLRSGRRGAPVLLQFAFSCRVLGMGVESWMYHKLGRPTLHVAGPVLSDVINDPRDIDWIAVAAPGGAAVAATARPDFTYVLARGGCDMRALSHYFGMMAARVIEEFDTVRDGQAALVNHSLIASQAMQGIDARAVRDFARLGFLPEDFRTVLAGELPPGPAIWLLGFAIENGVPIFRHRETGALLPAMPHGLGPRDDLAALMRGEPAGAVDPAVAAHLRGRFTVAGKVSDQVFRQNLRRIFGRAGDDVRVFVLLANTAALKHPLVARAMAAQNAAITEIAAEFGNVHTLDPAAFMSPAALAALTSPHHFDRMVYYRIFRHILQAAAGAPAG